MRETAVTRSLVCTGRIGVEVWKVLLRNKVNGKFDQG